MLSYLGSLVFRGGDEVRPVRGPLQIGNRCIRLVHLHIVQLFASLSQSQHLPMALGTG
jgi:hypothetical protein